MVLTDNDKKVLIAFTKGQSANTKHFSTDGKRLDGLWMGGNKIAYWKDGKIYHRPTSSKAEQTVVNKLKDLDGGLLISEEDTELDESFI